MGDGDGLARRGTGRRGGASARAVLALAACLGPAVPAFPKGGVVSTFPAATEALVALGLEGRVVGRSDYCRGAPGARRVGSAVSPDLEAVARLEPDLVVVPAMAGGGKLRRFLGDFGVPSLTVGIDRLADVPAALLALGRALGREDRARELVAGMRSALDRARARAGARRREGTPRPRAMVVVGGAGLHGRPGTVTAASRGTFYGDVLAEMGWDVVPAGPVRWPRVSLERFARMRADRLVLVVPGGAPPPPVDRWRALNPNVGRVHVLRGDGYLTPGPGIVERLARLAGE